MIAQTFLISDLFPLRYSKTRKTSKSDEIRLCWRKIFRRISTRYHTIELFPYADNWMMTMKRTCEIIFLLIAFLIIVPTIASGGQFKITRVYDGKTVRAEGYDRHCLP